MCTVVASKETKLAEDTPTSLPKFRGGSHLAKVWHYLKIAPRMPFVWFMRAYRVAVSPIYGDVCKYYPSCSKYALDAFELKGVVRGTALTVWRVCRCNPLSNGGVDYVAGSVLHDRSLEIQRRKSGTIGSDADN